MITNTLFGILIGIAVQPNGILIALEGDQKVAGVLAYLWSLLIWGMFWPIFVVMALSGVCEAILGYLWDRLESFVDGKQSQ